MLLSYRGSGYQPVHDGLYGGYIAPHITRLGHVSGFIMVYDGLNYPTNPCGYTSCITGFMDL